MNSHEEGIDLVEASFRTPCTLLNTEKLNSVDFTILQMTVAVLQRTSS